MQYQKPSDQSDPNAGFTDANPSVGQDGSIVPAKAIEHPQREIVYVIVQGGLTPDEDDLTQLYQAIRNIALGLLSGGGEGDPITGFLPLAGGTMDGGANINLLGGGVVKIEGQPVWHPGNDGHLSGLDADTVDGVEGAVIVRNDRNDEPIAGGKVRAKRLTASGNKGVLVVRGKDSNLGGGSVYFETDNGAVSMEFTLDDNRRILRGKMWSDAGNTYEDQFRFLDSGELYLRKLAGASIAGGNVAQAIINLQGVTGDGNTGPLNGTGIGSYQLMFEDSDGNVGPSIYSYPGTWVRRMLGPYASSSTFSTNGGLRSITLWQRIA